MNESKLCSDRSKLMPLRNWAVSCKLRLLRCLSIGRAIETLFWTACSRHISTTACAFLLFGLAGCASLNLALGDRLPKASVNDPVVQVLCMWQPADGHDPDGRPCRGFNGQILFLSRKKGTPVEVEGDVRIYLFDNKGTEEDQSKPMHQFDFDNGSWAIHLAKSPLGATYTVFIPYVKRGVTDADCSLRVRLKSKQGPIVMSEFSNVQLNGNKKPLRGDDARPLSKTESDRMTAEALASRLKASATPAPNSQMKSTEIGFGDPSKANPIQLASHEVVPEKAKPSIESDRIHELETMMKKLLEKQANRRDSDEFQQTTRSSAGRENPSIQENDASSERIKFPMQKKRQAVDRDEPRRIDSPRRTERTHSSHPLDEDRPTKDVPKTIEDTDLNTEQEIDDPFDSPIETTSIEKSAAEIQRYRRTYR